MHRCLLVRGAGVSEPRLSHVAKGQIAPRFLALFSNDLPSAEQAQLTYNAFRLQKNLMLSPEQHKEFPHDASLQRVLPNCMLGKTARGDQDVSLSAIGELDCAALRAQPGLSAALLHRHHLLMEHLLFLGQQRGQHQGTNILIADMRGFSLRLLEEGPLRLLRDISRSDEQYYPLLTEQVLLINAPLALRAAWTVIHPILNATLRNRVHFVVDSADALLNTLLDPATLQAVLARMA